VFRDDGRSSVFRAAAGDASMNGPLDDCRILELCHFISGPSAAALLADQGAEVIKVEPPTGDAMRTIGPARGGIGAAFITWNRNKLSLAVDLRSEEGRSILHRLVPQTDVVLHNFRPGVAARLGIDEPSMRALRPDLIYATLSGFGDTGPYADHPAYDCILQGLSGIAAAQSGTGGTPQLVRSPIIDKLSGIVAAQAITAALCARSRTGRGSSVDVAMLDLAVSFAWGDVMGRETFVGDIAPSSTLAAGDWIQPTQDGVIVCQPTSDLEFAALARLVNRNDWLQDPRFATMPLRSQHLAAFCGELKTAFRSRTTRQWCELLEPAGIPHAPALSPAEVCEDPQVRHNKIIKDGQHSLAGSIRQCRAAARFDGQAPPLRLPAPALGEHTAAILARVGYSDLDIVELQQRGIIYQPPANHRLTASAT